MMTRDPKDLGYVKIDIPGFTVGDLLGKGAFSTVYLGQSEETPADVKSDEIAAATAAAAPPNYMVHQVPGDGNCFFHAIAHQLQLAGILDSSQEEYSHEILRELTESHVNSQPALRAFMSDEEHVDLSRQTGYVDHGSIAALAAVLNVTIEVTVATSGQTHTIDGLEIAAAQAAAADDEGEGEPRVTLRILYNGHNHYDSLVSLAHTTAETESYNMMRDNENAKNRKGDSALPVAIKIFSSSHRQMRDWETTVLRHLTHNSNVPEYVESLDTALGPVIIVRPAAKPVLPVKNGVLTNKTDYVKLVLALRAAHNAGLCHRDVKPDNIFKDSDDRIILNDWSSSSKTGERVSWAGSEHFYERKETHCPDPADDLVALVRSVYLMYTRNDRFDHINLSQLWSQALQLARNCDYDGLLAFFNKL